MTTLAIHRIAKGFTRFSPRCAKGSEALVFAISKRLTSVFLCVLVAIGGTPAKAETVEVRYTFAAPTIAPANDAFCSIVVEGCDTLNIPGKPQLPFRTARILLPSNASVKSVEVELLAPIQGLDLEAPVVSGCAPFPIGGSDPAAAPMISDAPDPAVYSLDLPYPESRVQLMSVQKMHGHSIAIVRVFPVQYKPLSATLLFCPELAVKVVLNASRRKVAPASSGVKSTERAKRVMDFVDNPQENVESRLGFLSTPLDIESYDYLLVTKVALTNSFQPLVAQKIADGLSVKVTTVESILTTQAGRDNAEKLRDYIVQAYANWGITYVLLGGDVGTVPHRGAYGYIAADYYDATMPCDLYFACLDGSWNSDNDANWGEPTDGEDGEEVDLIAEVYVGRAPVDTPEETARFVEKIVRYEQGGHANAGKALFLGEWLGQYGTIHSQGGDALSALLPSFKDFKVSWLDDRPNNKAMWTTAQAMTALNTSPHLVAHYGHASENLALRMNSNDLSNLTNADLFLLNSGGCDAGAFDKGDCFAEQMIKLNACGAFAVIMNTRYGWFNISVEQRYSGEFMQKFFDRMLMQDAGSIGAAHFLSKQDMVGSVERTANMTYRWCYFENTLFGDPHVALHHDALDPKPKTAYTATAYVGGPFTPAQQTYALANESTVGLTWVALHSASWLSVTPASGTIGPGATTEVSLSFTTNAEALMPESYTDVVTFSNTVSGFATSRSVTLTVSGSISLQREASSVMESNGASVGFIVSRHANVDQVATVDFATSNGTPASGGNNPNARVAFAGIDYVATNGTLTFAVGETSKRIEVNMINDEEPEQNKSFKFTLSNPTGSATLQAPSVMTMSITDDDWLDHFAWSEIAPEQTAESPFVVTAKALNLSGGVLTGFNGFCDIHATRNDAFEYDVVTGTTPWNYPLASLALTSRTQAIYTPEEVGEAGLLLALSLQVTTIPIVTFNTWTIRVKHTTLSTYDAATWQWETNDWVVAYQSNVGFPSLGWKRFDFPTPFAYNGTQNLMVDFSYQNSVVSQTQGYCNAALVAANRSIVASANSTFGSPLEWKGRTPQGTVSTRVPAIRVEERALVPSTPPQTGAFVNGVWTGEVVIQALSTNVVLRLYDRTGFSGTSTPFNVPWLGLVDWLALYGIPSDGSADERDDDHDGFVNRAEWVAGTNPTNHLARLCIEPAVGMDADGAFTIRWQSVPGKRYRVESAESLSPSSVFTTFASNILSVAESTEVRDTRPASEAARFYRVGVE